MSKIVKSLKEGLENFHCNYNEVDDQDEASDVLENLIKLPSLKVVDFVGNVESAKFNKAAIEAFEKRNVALKCFEEDLEDVEEDEDDDCDVDKLTERLSQLEI